MQPKVVVQKVYVEVDVVPYQNVFADKPVKRRHHKPYVGCVLHHFVGYSRQVCYKLVYPFRRLDQGGEGAYYAVVSDFERGNFQYFVYPGHKAVCLYVDDGIVGRKGEQAVAFEFTFHRRFPLIVRASRKARCADRAPTLRRAF